MVIKIPAIHIWRPKQTFDECLIQLEMQHEPNPDARLVLEKHFMRAYHDAYKQVIEDIISHLSPVRVSFPAPAPNEVVLIGSKKSFEALAKHLYLVMSGTLGAYYDGGWQEHAKLEGWTPLKTYIKNMIGWAAHSAQLYGYERPQDHFERLLS